MIIEIGRDVEGNDCDLMWNTITTFAWKVLRNTTLVFCQNIHCPKWYSNLEQKSVTLTVEPTAAVKGTVVRGGRKPTMARIMYRVYIAWQTAEVLGMECLHSSGYPVTTSVLRTAIKDTYCRMARWSNTEVIQNAACKPYETYQLITHILFQL